MPQVLLGFPGDVTGTESVSYDVTKVGGKPVLPEAAGWGEWRPPVCGVCTQPSSLVLQAYAPLPGHDRRILLLFACLRPGCSRQAAAWSCMRCEWGGDTQLMTGDATQQLAESAVTTEAASTDDWGTSSTDHTNGSKGGGWDGWGADSWAQEGQDNGGENWDFAELNAALDAAVASTAAAAPSAPVTAKPATVATYSAPLALPSCTVSSGPVLPEFYICAVEEAAAGRKSGMTDAEKQHVQELLLKYEAEEATASGRKANQTGGTSGLQASMGEDGMDAEDGSERSWAQEEYEEEQVRGVSPAFLKFSKRLRLQPEQCVRYSPRNEPLWPSDTPAEQIPCPACGGDTAFELQLMPPLIPALSEALDMLRDSTCGQKEISTEACNTWMECDWLTVAVFTCVHSCTYGPQLSLQQEVVAMAFEEEWRKMKQ